MENIDGLLNKLKERLTLEQELLIKEFHFEKGEARKLGDEEGDSYRIIEDKLTGAIFKVKHSNMVIKSKEGLYYTVEEFNDFLDKRFDEIFGTSIAKKKKYRVFLRIYQDQGSESNMIYDTDEMEVMATDKDDAIKQWIGVYGEPYYYYPTAQEIV